MSLEALGAKLSQWLGLRRNVEGTPTLASLNVGRKSKDKETQNVSSEQQKANNAERTKSGFSSLSGIIKWISGGKKAPSEPKEVIHHRIDRSQDVELEKTPAATTLPSHKAISENVQKEMKMRLHKDTLSPTEEKEALLMADAIECKVSQETTFSPGAKQYLATLKDFKHNSSVEAMIDVLISNVLPKLKEQRNLAVQERIQMLTGFPKSEKPANSLNITTLQSDNRNKNAIKKEIEKRIQDNKITSLKGNDVDTICDAIIGKLQRMKHDGTIPESGTVDVGGMIDHLLYTPEKVKTPVFLIDTLTSRESQTTIIRNEITKRMGGNEAVKKRGTDIAEMAEVVISKIKEEKNESGSVDVGKMIDDLVKQEIASKPFIIYSLPSSKDMIKSIQPEILRRMENIEFKGDKIALADKIAEEIANGIAAQMEKHIESKEIDLNETIDEAIRKAIEPSRFIVYKDLRGTAKNLIYKEIIGRMIEQISDKDYEKKHGDAIKVVVDAIVDSQFGYEKDEFPPLYLGSNSPEHMLFIEFTSMIGSNFGKLKPKENGELNVGPIIDYVINVLKNY